MRLFALLTLLPTLLLAQLNGRVVDADGGNQPVAYATVSLLDAADSSLLEGAVAGAIGEWQFAEVPAKSILVRASFVGYEDTYHGPFLPNSLPTSPFTLHLRSAAQVLKEVEVRGQRLTDLHRVDKQVFDAQQFENARGGTAVDILRNLPAVSVGADGNINVRGTSGFQLVIDGRLTQGHAEDLLRQIPANAIESIEFITSPSARYDPDGKGGIINVQLKKNTLLGWSVAANSMIGLPSVEDYDNAERPHRYGADLTAGYRGDKIEYTLGLDYLRNDVAGRRIGYVNTYLNSILTEFPSAGERSFVRENYSARASLSYLPDQRQRLIAGFFAGKRTQFRTADILYTNQRRTRIDPGNFQGTRFYYDRYRASGDVVNGETLTNATFYNENLRVRRGDFLIASLDYDLQVGEGKLSLSGLYEHTLLGGPTDNRVLSWPDLQDTFQLQRNDNDNPLDGLRLGVDYVRSLGEFEWESGYQFRYLRHPGDFEYLDRDFEANTFVINPEFTNGILLRRDIHAVYSQLAGQAGERLEFNAGLRVEHFDRRVSIDRPDTTYLLDRLNLFPSANLRYRLTDGLALKAGYSRRIERTTTFKMTPFPEREHNETLEQGDAELLPELTDVVEAGLAGNWGGDNSAFANIYYRHVRDVINRVNTVYNDTILNRIYTNAGNATALGLEGGLTYFPVPGWRVYLSGNIFRYRIRGTLFEETVNTATTVYSISANTDVQFSETFSGQLGIDYLSERVTAQGVDSRFYSPYMSLKKEFPERRLSVAFQWQHIDLGLWNANEQAITTFQDDFFTTTNYVYEPDVLRLSVGYRFTKVDREAELLESEFGGREF